MNKAELKAAIQKAIRTDERAAIRALVLIYDNQTADEKVWMETKHYNGVGFTAFDAEYLTSLAVQYNIYGSLSAKQVTSLKRAMPKYWRQLMSRADEKINGKEEVELYDGVPADVREQELELEACGIYDY